mgnify:FL=1
MSKENMGRNAEHYVDPTPTAAMRNIIRKATKEQEGKSVSLEMAKSSILLNALVQHGGLDSVDILALSVVDERLHRHQGGEKDAVQ